MKDFATQLISWYQINKRDLPWRNTTDPYKIWLSEIILQQTRVAQGLPYFKQFIKEFPTLFDLASASERDVLRLWQGLGYYSRARNLHACAKKIVNDFNGKIPTDYKTLLKLPGIGSYTAAAIASFSAKEPVAVVDGNVFRVLARVFGIDHDISGAEGKKIFAQKAGDLLSKEKPDLYNQAIMDFGAIVCTPKSPRCDDCIFKTNCVAQAHDLQHLLPVKAPKTKIKKRYFNYFAIFHQDKILMRPRTGKDIWKGLYEFYLIESSRPEKPEKLMVKDKFLSQFKLTSVHKPFTHILSHQHLIIQIATASYQPVKNKITEMKDLTPFTLAQIKKLPKPVPVNQFIENR